MGTKTFVRIGDQVVNADNVVSARLAAQRFRIDSDSRFRPAGVIPPTRDLVVSRLFPAAAFFFAQ